MILDERDRTVVDNFIGLYLEFLFKTLIVILIAQEQLIYFPGDVEDYIHEFSFYLNFN